MEGFWPIMFMLVVLKVPAIFMIYLLYWAARTEPENGMVDETDDDGGRKRRPRPLFPRGPRRGPHGGGVAKPAPRRARTAPPAVAQRVRSGSRKAEPARAREHEPARSPD